jgi:hypothetical protein
MWNDDGLDQQQAFAGWDEKIAPTPITNPDRRRQ